VLRENRRDAGLGVAASYGEGRLHPALRCQDHVVHGSLLLSRAASTGRKAPEGLICSRASTIPTTAPRSGGGDRPPAAAAEAPVEPHRVRHEEHGHVARRETYRRGERDVRQRAVPRPTRAAARAGWQPAGGCPGARTNRRPPPGRPTRPWRAAAVARSSGRGRGPAPTPRTGRGREPRSPRREPRRAAAPSGRRRGSPSGAARGLAPRGPPGARGSAGPAGGCAPRARPRPAPGTRSTSRGARRSPSPSASSSRREASDPLGSQLNGSSRRAPRGGPPDECRT
jgi:hypothetical protein